jgi:hypothetical protein
LENGVVAGLDNAGILGGIGQLAFVLPEFRPDGKPALLFEFRIAQFLAAGLDCKIGLALGNDFLGRICVLNHKVTGIAGHHHGLHRTLSAFANFDHIGDFNEMILHPLAAVEACRAGGFDHGLKVAIIRVAEHFGKVPTGPEFVASGIRAANGFKGCGGIGHGKKRMKDEG